jgi:hypothetical protein
VLFLYGGRKRRRIRFFRLAAAEGLPAQAGGLLTAKAREAFVQAMDFTATVETGLVMLLAVIAVLMLHRVRPPV